MTLVTFLGFIKYAFAGTGTANDINTLIIILLFALVLILGIPYLVSSIQRYLLKHLQNGNETDETLPNDFKINNDSDYS